MSKIEFEMPERRRSPAEYTFRAHSEGKLLASVSLYLEEREAHLNRIESHTPKSLRGARTLPKLYARVEGWLRREGARRVTTHAYPQVAKFLQRMGFEYKGPVGRAVVREFRRSRAASLRSALVPMEKSLD